MEPSGWVRHFRSSHSWLLTHLIRSQCVAILQGHTSLVGQLQLRSSTLVTGGSDGSVRVWSLLTHSPIHRLAAHDNSVTSLQFDETRIVSGGSDGRVKIWDLNTGAMVRELSQPAEAVWRVAFESERCVVLASRSGRTVMEVWDFSPQGEEDDEGDVREGEEEEKRIGTARPDGDETDAEMLDIESEVKVERSRKIWRGKKEMEPFTGDESEEMTD